MIRVGGCLALLCLAAGCHRESDVARATRLRSAAVLACAAADEMLRPHDGYSYTDSARTAQRARCDVAQRAYNRFMAGR